MGRPYSPIGQQRPYGVAMCPYGVAIRPYRAAIFPYRAAVPLWGGHTSL